jgi:hypothetical protein
MIIFSSPFISCAEFFSTSDFAFLPRQIGTYMWTTVLNVSQGVNTVATLLRDLFHDHIGAVCRLWCVFFCFLVILHWGRLASCSPLRLSSLHGRVGAAVVNILPLFERWTKCAARHAAHNDSAAAVVRFLVICVLEKQITRLGTNNVLLGF